MSLTAAFWQDSWPALRRLVLDEAAGRTTGRAVFTLDMYDVELNFDAGTATVTNMLQPEESETTDLTAFLSRAASFGDDPSIGDGLTQAQRHPPRYRVDATGEVERLDDTSP